MILIPKDLQNGSITQPHVFIRISVRLLPPLGEDLPGVSVTAREIQGGFGQQDLAHDPRQDPKGLIIRRLTVGQYGEDKLDRLTR